MSRRSSSGRRVRVGVLQVVQEPEELQEHLGGLPALQRVRDLADDPAHRPVADAVVDRLELLVDEQRDEVAAPHLAVDDLPHRQERGVRQARELHEVDQDEVQVLERLPEERERGLRRRVADELLDVGVEGLVLPGSPSTYRSKRAEVRPAPRSGWRRRAGRPARARCRRGAAPPTSCAGRAPGSRARRAAGPDPEEPLEAPEPHLELEELLALPAAAPGPCQRRSWPRRSSERSSARRRARTGACRLRAPVAIARGL